MNPRLVSTLAPAAVAIAAWAIAASCAAPTATRPTPIAPASSEHAGAAASSAWNDLIAGNDRYVAGKAARPNQSDARRTELVAGQHPKAAVLSCSDSRVPPEIVFDQGLGDLFVVRVAGNTAGEVAVGSLEYAVEHLGVGLIVVLGHDKCGAVQAAVGAVDSHDGPEAHIGAVISPLFGAVRAVAPRGGDLVDSAVTENALRAAEGLEASEPLLAPLARRRKLQVVAARYSLDTGRVRELQRN